MPLVDKGSSWRYFIIFLRGISRMTGELLDCNSLFMHLSTRYLGNALRVALFAIQLQVKLSTRSRLSIIPVIARRQSNKLVLITNIIMYRILCTENSRMTTPWFMLISSGLRFRRNRANGCYQCTAGFFQVAR